MSTLPSLVIPATATRVIIALDIDGVIAPVRMPDDPFLAQHCIELPNINHGTHVLTHMLAAIRYWHRLGAQILWHTTWREPYASELAELVRLPITEQFATDEQFLCPTPRSRWWKLAAVEDALAEMPMDTHLIWIDDDIADAVASAEITPELIAHPQLSLVSPDWKGGLTREGAELITQALRDARLV